MSLSQQLVELQLIWFIAVTVTGCIIWYLLNNVHNTGALHSNVSCGLCDGLTLSTP